MALNAHFASLAETTIPVAATDLAIIPIAFVLPELAVVGVFSALGAGYLEARHLVADENTKAGFARRQLDPQRQNLVYHRPRDSVTQEFHFV